MVVQTTDLTYVLADMNNRIRSLENKYSLFGERLLIVNQNMIEEYKKVMKEMKAIDADVQRMKAELAETRSVIKSAVSEMDLFARKDQVRVLEKYLDLWSPMHFVTEDQVNQLVEQRLAPGKRKE